MIMQTLLKNIIFYIGDFFFEIVYALSAPTRTKNVWWNINFPFCLKKHIVQSLLHNCVYIKDRNL